MALFRLNQKVCRVSYRKGQPFIEVGTVTKATQTTYYVNKSKKQSCCWFGNWRQAIDDEYLELFRMGIGEPKRGWTIEDTVRCVSRVRRIEQRLMRRGKTTR